METQEAIGGKRAVNWRCPPSFIGNGFDPLFLDGVDLRNQPLEERCERLRRLIPKRTRAPLQFSEAITGDGPSIVGEAEQIEVEGIVSKRIGSRYRSGRSDRWLKTKCFTDTALVLIGTERKDKGPPAALLARRHDGDLVQ